MKKTIVRQCCRCQIYFKFTRDDTFFNEEGTGYSARLIKCPKCGHIHIVRFIEDYAMQMLGDDGLDYRYYEYENY